MPIVRLRQPLRRLADDRSEHRIDAPTAAAALVTLEREHPDLRGWILDERGEVRRHINVYVNGEARDPHVEVGQDDRIDVLPAISGGGRPR